MSVARSTQENKKVRTRREQNSEGKAMKGKKQKDATFEKRKSIKTKPRVPQIKKDVKATECFQRRTIKLEKQGWKAKALISWSTLEKRRLKEDFIAHYSFLWKGNGEGGVDLFSLVLSNRTCGNGSQLHM